MRTGSAGSRNWGRWGGVTTVVVIAASCGGQSAVVGPAGRPVQRPAAVVTCLDVTKSLPQSFVRASRDRIARDVEELVEGPIPETTVFVRRIGMTSDDPGAAFLTASFPVVPDEPVRPASNPYSDEERARANAAYERALADWQKVADEARRLAGEAAADIRNISLTPDNRTEPLGCLSKAAELIGSKVGLVKVFSDLKRHRAKPPKVELALEGISVKIIYWCDDGGEVCQARKTRWHARLTDAGASVEWVDASDEPAW